MRPELDAFLVSVPPKRPLIIQRLVSGRCEHFLTIAGTIAVITSVLAEAGAAVLVAVVANYSLPAALAAGGTLAGVCARGDAPYQRRAWAQLDEAFQAT